MTDAAGGDQWVRAVAADGQIRVLAARTTGTVETARRRHGTAPTATAALGRVLTAAALLAVLLKDDQKLTLRILGDGPLGGLVAAGLPDGRVRGYVQHPDVHLPLRPDGKLDVGGAVGRRGTISVTRDLGLREPYTGSALLVSGEIGEDLTAYLWQSEQTPSLVSLGVLVNPDGSVRAAGGLLVQLLPGADPEWARRLEANARSLAGISRRVDDGLSPAGMAERVLEGFDSRILAEGEVRFACGCSRARVEGLLAALGREELTRMLEEDGGAELTCRFCGERYNFGADDLRRLLLREA